MQSKFKITCRRAAVIAILLGAAAPSSAEEIFLQNGDRLTGEVIEVTDDRIILQTEALGTVTILRSLIREEMPPEEHAVPDTPPITTPQEPPPSELPDIKLEKPWDGSVSGGINAREGNTSNQSASGRFDVTRKRNADELRLSGDMYFSAAQKKMTAMKMLGGVRYDHFFEEENRGWYGLARFEADQDRFADINQRMTPAAGPGYAFVNTKDFKIKAEIAGGFSQTNFRDASANRFEGILIPRFYFESRIYGESRFIQDMTVYNSLTESGEYRLRSESTIEAPFWGRLKIRLSVIDDYNSNPSIEAQNNDIRLISSVAYYL